MPGLVAFVAIVFGIYGLVWEVLAGKVFAATLAIIGVIGVYVMTYDERKNDYNNVGRELTILFNRLRDLYRTAKSCPDVELDRIAQERAEIEVEFYRLAISRQILLSDWYAHYKFFWQHQIDWIDEQKKFRLFRDKLPLSFMVIMALLLLIVGAGIARHWACDCAAEPTVAEQSPAD